MHSQPNQFTGGCLWHVNVRNLPTWGSTPNPTSDGTFLRLAHHYSADSDYSLPDDPYQTKRELFCRNEPKMFEMSAFRFSFSDAPGAEVFAPPGQTVTWSVPAGEHAGEYRVRTLAALSWIQSEPEYEYNYWIARK